MRNVAQQSSLGFDERFNSPRHYIKVAAQMTDFISPAEQTIFDSHTEFAFRQLLSDTSQLFHRRREIFCEPVTEHAAYEENRQKISRNRKQREAKSRPARHSEQPASKRWIFGHEHVNGAFWRSGCDCVYRNRTSEIIDEALLFSRSLYQFHRAGR